MTTRALVLAVLFALAPVLAGCGQEEKPAPPAPGAGTPDAGTPDEGTPDEGTPDEGTPDAGTAPATRRIAFVDGFSAGVAQAKDDDALLFVYVGRHHPT